MLANMFFALLITLPLMPLAYLILTDIISPKIKKYKRRHITFGLVVSDELNGNFKEMLISKIYHLHNSYINPTILDELIDVNEKLNHVGEVQYNEDSSYHELIEDRIVKFIKYVVNYDETIVDESRLSHEIRLINDTLERDAVGTLKRFQ